MGIQKQITMHSTKRQEKKNALIVNILIHNNSEYLCQLIEDCSED